MLRQCMRPEDPAQFGSSVVQLKLIIFREYLLLRFQRGLSPADPSARNHN